MYFSPDHGISDLMVLYNLPASFRWKLMILVVIYSVVAIGTEMLIVDEWRISLFIFFFFGKFVRRKKISLLA
jgi:hypothetical protein